MIILFYNKSERLR